MSEAAVLEAFPRRPINVVGAKTKAVRFRNGIIIFLLLCLPAAWLTNKLVRENDLRTDLAARGVSVDTLSTEGECMSRRGVLEDEPQGCWLDVTYQVRPEDGGGERTVNTYIRGAAPILPPDTVYDPENPDRMMLAPMVADSLSTSELFITGIAIVVPLAFLALWMLNLTRGLEAAARDPQPLFVPVGDVTDAGNYTHTKLTAPSGRTFTGVIRGARPFLMDSADGTRRGLALMGPKGKPQILDDGLKTIELTEDERRRIFDAAGWR